MISKLENKIIVYVALILGTLLNIHKVTVLFPGKRLMSNYWDFNLPELIYQTLFNIGFCLIVGIVNLRVFKTLKINTKRSFLVLIITNIVFTLFMIFISYNSQKYIFDNVIMEKVSLGGNFLRFAFSSFTMVILAKFMVLLEASENKEKENRKLKEAYFNAEIKNLKGQINPHFLFNCLNSLSGLIREDTEKAQQFIANLSKVFRYTLRIQKQYCTTLNEEIKVLNAYAALQQIRMEAALEVTIAISANYFNKMLPVMSLQPLLENAIKHNYASEEMPLMVEVYIEDNYVVVKNNLQKNNVQEESTGIGLANLAERYTLLYKTDITIIQEDTFFKVLLPLQ